MLRWVSLSSNLGVLSILRQGVQQIKNTTLDPVYLFLSPPSLAALCSRLQRRGTETEVAIQKRLAAALKEIEYANQPNTHDLVIVNDDLERAYALFRDVALGKQITSDALPLFNE